MVVHKDKDTPTKKGVWVYLRFKSKQITFDGVWNQSKCISHHISNFMQSLMQLLSNLLLWFSILNRGHGPLFLYIIQPSVHVKIIIKKFYSIFSTILQSVYLFHHNFFSLKTLSPYELKKKLSSSGGGGVLALLPSPPSLLPFLSSSSSSSLFLMFFFLYFLRLEEEKLRYDRFPVTSVYYAPYMKFVSRRSISLLKGLSKSTMRAIHALVKVYAWPSHAITPKAKFASIRGGFRASVIDRCKVGSLAIWHTLSRHVCLTRHSSQCFFFLVLLKVLSRLKIRFYSVFSFSLYFILSKN